MIRWHIPLVLVGLLAVPAWAQTSPRNPYPAPPTTPGPTTPAPSSTAPYATIPYHPTTPYPTSQYPTTRYPTSQYPTASYPSSPATASGRPLTPAEAAAQKQSGLSEADVQTLLQNQGYSRLNSIQADPGSLWVWQADAVKNGRPVRVGVDYRGQILVISPQANRPCASPGVNFGIGGLGVGARMSAAASCRQ